ncbi:MAG: copper amine oxidase N-terminal domain-containing protein [Oscillospiraceae bacterium]|nr:copper amine oxidase N-terminal domain-containing protein [Oscillospiraceae bacterium]
MKLSKSLISCILTICMMIALAVSASANEITVTDIMGKPYVIGSNVFSVEYNGAKVAFPDAQPFVDDNNRTLVPVRFVSETMGTNVSWDGNTQTAKIAKGDIAVSVTIGKSNLTVVNSGTTSTVTMDTQAVLKDSRTFVPVRYVAEALGAYVGYSDLFNTAQIYSDVLTPTEIARLHGYSDMSYQEYLTSTGKTSTYTEADWIKRNPQIAYFVGNGTYGFNNANEWVLRNPNGIETLRYTTISAVTYTGILTGKTYKYGTQADTDFVKLIMNEAETGVATSFTDVKATLRTDLSCVFASRHSNNAAGYVRGVMSITIPQNADVNAIATKYNISNAKAGGTYQSDVEVTVATYEGKIGCINIRTLQ